MVCSGQNNKFMEKAILKTLIYSNIFDYPLKAYEIHKWLISEKANLRQVEKALQKLYKKNKVLFKNGYYFLPSTKSIILKRSNRQKQSEKFFWKTKYLTWFLKLVPWVKLVGISGGLAMENAEKEDDIDLFIILSKNRLWISRLLITCFLDAMGVRRKVNMKSNQVSGKLCTNILVEQDKLEQLNKDLYVAHEVLQMKVLWQKNNIYKKYLEDNTWVFKFLPNWIGSAWGPAVLSLRGVKGVPRRGTGDLYNRDSHVPSGLGMTVERIAKWFQLKIMKKPKGLERIEDGALYFHPNDIRLQILEEYKKRIKNI